LLTGMLCASAAAPRPEHPRPDLFRENWITLNGDIGVNVWVEENGDLLLVISKTDAWDENARLCKIGRVRVKFDPPQAVKAGFRQELKLREGVIEISAKLSATRRTLGNNTEAPANDNRSPMTDNFFLRLWVDANQPVARVEAESAAPVQCRAEVELWRLRERPFGPEDDSHSSSGLSGQAWKPVVLPDVVVPSTTPRVVWYHRNTRSVDELGLQVQHLEALKGRFTDPLLNRTFGASLRGEGFVADGRQALKSGAPAKRHTLSVTVLTAQTAAPEVWLAQLDELESKAGQIELAEAAAFPETMYFWGLPNNGDYGWNNPAPEPANGYIRRYWNGSLELIAVMLDRFDFTQDQQFAKDTLVPLADPLIAFFDQYWRKRDANGKIIFDPAQSLETWHVAVNPLPEIAGLRFVLPRLLALPGNINRSSRFPAFWGPNFDWIPDQDHGDNILTTLQFMLLQSDGRKIYLLPAWPKNWNVSFKLHAPYRTTVEGELRDGKVTSLTVTPQSRATDVVNLLAK
jgi:hypothetical protein